jgi:hypothetical protein
MFSSTSGGNLMGKSPKPTKTLFLILVPMLATFAIQRLILHHSNPDTHVFITGYLVHHLFSGVLILIPTAFLLALGIQSPWRRNLAFATLGFSSAMVLDEVVYLVCTDGSGVAYRGSLSLWGAVVLLALATLFLLSVYCMPRGSSHPLDVKGKTTRESSAQGA